jgi:3-methylfumaryl-CoA hydratase
MNFESATSAVLRGPAQAVMREEVCTLSSVRRVAAMLDVAPLQWDAPQATLPRGWHFMLLAADTPRAALRADGFPGLGVPMPDLGLPRLVLGGRTVRFHQDIGIGAKVSRSSTVENIAHKTTAAGPMAVVTLAHALTVAGQTKPALFETQTYLLMPARETSAPLSAAPRAAAKPAVAAQHLKTVVPDDTLLFQYSALGFNSHRIHLDRRHAREVEGFEDLVVNGGLVTLLLTEFLRQELGVSPAAMAVRHVAPLYCNRPVTLAADEANAGWRLMAYDDQNRLAVDMQVTV